MDLLIYILAAYGLVYGVQQKLPFLRYWKLRDLLDCPYCLGFWAGWAVWGLSWAFERPVFATAPASSGALLDPLAGFLWAMAVAAACVVLDGLSEPFEEEP